MAEYIERKRIYAAISRLIITKSAADFTHYEEGRDDAISDVLKTIEKLPAADVRPERHGKWIADDVESSDGTYAAYIEAHCSECNFALGFESGEYGWYIGDRIPFDYCPHCGAKMDGRDGESDERI